LSCNLDKGAITEYNNETWSDANLALNLIIATTDGCCVV
jgi:hypothetical protein